MINTIILGHALNVLPQLPAESVSCVTTSPPYWGLRDYGIEPVIWDGDKDCKHIWKIEITKRPNASSGKTDWAKEKLAIKGVENYQEYVDYHKRETTSDFCQRCNAWRGSLGLEPTFKLYIKHLCDIFDEVKRVLRKDGTCFVNIGDSYANTGVVNKSEWKHKESIGTVDKKIKIPLPSKSLCDIPYRFSIEIINRGWIKRNTIIWHKPNCMPSSADDRFTVDFEYLFFFSKSNKTLFWTNEKTLECVSKNPPGIKGIEGKDWEWRPCPACSDKDYFNIRTRDVMRKEKDCPQFKASDKEKENIKSKICPRCKGLKKVKYSFWSGHDYWFEQQFEEHTTKDDLDRRKNKFWSENIADGGSGKQNKGRDRREFYGKQGRNKRCVWTIPTQPFPEAHFAVYPETLIEPIIKAGCPEFICKKCGKARVKILEPTEEYKKLLGKSWHPHKHDAERGMSETPDKKASCTAEYKFKGYSDCGCNAGWESGIVLDLFMGSGTTALVALKQRKRFIGIEIKQEYIDMSYKRISKVQQRIF